MNTLASSPSNPSVLRASWRQWLRMDAPRAGSRWLQVLWTALFSAALALAFTVIGFALNAHSLADWADLHAWAVGYGRNLVVSLTIGFAIQALFTLARVGIGATRILALPDWQRALFFTAVPLLGVAIGWPVGVSLIFGDLHVVAGLTSAGVLSMIVLSTLISGLIFAGFAMRHREIRAELRAQDAQLRLLQGQMEPHFLFNTLATVISLIDADAPRAKQVLEAFTDYLRASLGSLRRDDSTLGAELELATRYLQLMQARMGERLRFEIDVDASVRQAALAPLLLQPLIENAVKHGLEPQVDGGTVRIHAALVQVDGRDMLEIHVDDDGAGLAAAARRPRRTVGAGPDGHGVAVANLHERLLVRFGAQARLTLSDRAPEPGTRACLQLPWREVPVVASTPPRRPA